MSFENDNACLSLHKEALKCRVQDFIISFRKEQTSIENVLQVTSDLFAQLVKTYGESRRIKARLVAKVRFIHFNTLTDETEERFYHFPSYSSEFVYDVQEFYQRHLEKIASRLDCFNKNGSNLLIKNIAHIHICINRQPSRKDENTVCV